MSPVSVTMTALGIAALGCGGGGASGPSGRDWERHPAVVTVTGAGAIDVLGDLHGDPEVTTRMLAAAGLTTSTSPVHWTGGDRTLVVTGDVIDKGSLATPLIDVLMTLEEEAAAAGGRVIVTLGNHEAEFVSDPEGDKVAQFRDELMTRGLAPTAVARGETPVGAWLLSRPVAAVIDGWFFSHAGNTKGRSLGELADGFKACWKSNGNPDFDCPFLLADDSLLESQEWWDNKDALSTVEFNLAVLPAEHLVFGHDPGDLGFPGDPQGERKAGTMAMRYDGRLFLVDVGMSYAVGYSSGAMLRITRNPDKATAFYPDGTARDLWP
jgi:hypothetical protein